jgi:membrane-bound lytic murein transglycosylase A
MSRVIRVLGAVALAMAASACVQRAAVPPVPAPPPAPIATPLPPPKPIIDNAMLAGVTPASPRQLEPAAAARALAAFRLSCPKLVTRTDASGLTRGEDWRALCTDAGAVAPADAPAFFRDRFSWVQVGKGEAFATGYYEPEIAGSRTASPAYPVPVYGLPSDLVRCTRADGGEGRGRIDETGQCVLYYTRAEIDSGALAGRGLEIAWVADYTDLFFLQVQGSGRLRDSAGNIMRIGYAGQNGREYVAIGRLLRERGLLEPGTATMQGITRWIRTHPAEGKALMEENLSYIFFRELTGPGPLGALDVPVTARASVAADPLFVPLGAPAFLEMERAEASGLWIAQDTGGAIKGANRFDTFWGAGAEATKFAGGMSASGHALILLPKGVAARASAQP